jgi:hypothetical protein
MCWFSTRIPLQVKDATILGGTNFPLGPLTDTQFDAGLANQVDNAKAASFQYSYLNLYSHRTNLTSIHQYSSAN